MIKLKRSAEQQVADELERRALHPLFRGRRYRTAKPSQNSMQTTNALEQKGWRERQSSWG
jgi:hypothetical protein